MQCTGEWSSMHILVKSLLLLLRSFRICAYAFGSCNTPATFQQLMQVVLVGLEDILVVSHTFEEHLQHIQAVFERLWLKYSTEDLVSVQLSA